MYCAFVTPIPLLWCWLRDLKFSTANSPAITEYFAYAWSKDNALSRCFSTLRTSDVSPTLAMAHILPLTNPSTSVEGRSAHWHCSWDSKPCGKGSTFSSFALAFLIEEDFSFMSLFAIWSVSPHRCHCYFSFIIVSWQCQKYWTILTLLLCLLCVTLLVGSSYFVLHSPFFSSWWPRDCELYKHTLVFKVMYRCRRVSPKRPIYVLIVGSDHCVMMSHKRCTCAARILSHFLACTLSISSLL